MGSAVAYIITSNIKPPHYRVKGALLHGFYPVLELNNIPILA